MKVDINADIKDGEIKFSYYDKEGDKTVFGNSDIYLNNYDDFQSIVINAHFNKEWLYENPDFIKRVIDMFKTP